MFLRHHPQRRNILVEQFNHAQGIDDQLNVIERVLANKNPNYAFSSKQRDVIRSVFVDESSATVCVGVFGAGKTDVLATITVLLAMMPNDANKKRILVVCKTSQAIKSFAKRVHTIAAGIGANTKQAIVLSDSNTTIREVDDPQYIARTLDIFYYPKDADALIDELSWDTLKLHRIHELAGGTITGSRHSAMKERAVSYLELSKTSEDRAQAFTNDPNSSLEELYDVSVEIEEYLVQELGVVYVNPASALRPAFAKSYKPDLLIFDDSGLLSVGDVCLAAASYGATAANMIFGGDHRQGEPLYENRLPPAYAKSLLRDLTERDPKEYAFFFLNEQQRMHKDLSEWPLREFYPHDAANSLTTERSNPLRRFVQDFNISFMSAHSTYNGHNRIALSLPLSTKAEHEKSDLHGLINRMEAKGAVNLLRNLFSYRSSTPGSKSRLATTDVAIVTMYQGQKQVVLRQLQEEDASQADPSIKFIEIKCHHVTEIDGLEASIVILLFSHNAIDGVKTGSHRNATYLNQAMTRAREGLYIFGGFGSFIGKSRKQLKQMFPSEDPDEYKAFISLMIDLNRTRDMVNLEEVMPEVIAADLQDICVDDIESDGDESDDAQGVSEALASLEVDED